MQNWIRLGLFLCTGGRSAWSIDDTDTDVQITEMLLENGFPVTKLHRTKTITYAEIDYSRLNMKNFYTWDEIQPRTSEEDVWRILKIPVALWSCPVFKEHFWKSASLPLVLSIPEAVEAV